MQCFNGNWPRMKLFKTFKNFFDENMCRASWVEWAWLQSNSRSEKCLLKLFNYLMKLISNWLEFLMPGWRSDGAVSSSQPAATGLSFSSGWPGDITFLLVRWTVQNRKIFHSFQDSNNCAVCLEEMFDHNSKRLNPCGHRFHHHCINVRVWNWWAFNLNISRCQY